MLEETRTCPRKIITAQSTQYLRYHKHYGNGVLLYAGGLLNQPQAFIEAMTVIEAYSDGH